MSNDNKIESIVTELQQTKYNFITNNCFHKSVMFKKRCQEASIKARMSIGFGLQYVGRFHYPFVHARGFIDGKKYEVTHTKEYTGINSHDFRDIFNVLI
jgi:hypothetical protein